MVALVFLLLCIAASEARVLERVLLPEAVEDGVVCLDGSPPAYLIGKGSGNGADKWIVHQGGGGWCSTPDECLERSKTLLGSSRFWPETFTFGGIFSDNATVNGEFYNWNVVYLGYCDGGGFSGYLKEPIVVNGTDLYSRGLPIFLTLVQHLLDSGMENATDIILTGCSGHDKTWIYNTAEPPNNDKKQMFGPLSRVSFIGGLNCIYTAGGVSTFLHADLMSTLVPPGANYKAMADGGYIPNVDSIKGLGMFGDFMVLVHNLHNMSGGSDQDCVENYSTNEEWKCLHAPYAISFVQSQIYIINSIYDELILSDVVGLECLPPSECSEEDTKVFENYRKEFLAALAPAINASAGIFADSCLIHCQTLTDEPWSTYAIGRKTARESFEEWYLEKAGSGNDQLFDCPFPCNPSCPVESPSTPVESPTAPGSGNGVGGSVGHTAAVLLILLIFA